MKKLILSTLLCFGLTTLSFAQMSQPQAQELFKKMGVTASQIQEVAVVGTAFIRYQKEVVTPAFSNYKKNVKFEIMKGGFLITQSEGGKPLFCNFINYAEIKNMIINAKYKWVRIILNH
ncbi:MAG TPA: hypothetical protein DCS93_36680 [Microscillaceae bacterium]|nr:hypothetical protein [Microscillaceae bacterium]